MHDQIELVEWWRVLRALDRAGPRGLSCGDLMSRMDVREAVQHQGADPGCAEYWAATYKQPAFEYDSASGHMALAKARWPLMLGVLWVAYGGNVDAVALEWVRFYHFWAAGIWNAPRQPDQVKSRNEAEREVWLALEGGLTAYGRRAGKDGRVAIPKTEWDHLRWVDDGMFQSVGSDGSMAFYDVVVEGEEVKKLTAGKDAEKSRRRRGPAQTAATYTVNATFNTAIDASQHFTDASDRRNFTFQPVSVMPAPVLNPDGEPKQANNASLVVASEPIESRGGPVTYDELIAWWAEFEHEHPEFEDNPPTRKQLEGYASAKFANRPTISWTSREGPWRDALKQRRYRLRVGQRPKK